MKIILKEKIRNLGDLGQTIVVKDGYARNYLIPKGKALQATAANVAIFEGQRDNLEKAAADRLSTAKATLTKLEGLKLVIEAKAGDSGKLFGSIGTRDIAALIVAEGVAIEKHEVRLPTGAIREIGTYDVAIHLHSDVEGEIQLTVKSDTADTFVDEEYAAMIMEDDAADEAAQTAQDAADEAAQDAADAEEESAEDASDEAPEEAAK